MKRWIDRWNAFWFPTTTTVSLAVARITAVATQLFWFFPSLQYHLNLMEKNSAFVDAQPLIRAITTLVPREAFFTRPIFTTIYWLTAVAGITALVGLFTRTSLLVLAFGIWFLVSHGYSYGDVHHPEALFAFFLVTLALAPSGNSLSIDALIRGRARAASGPTEERQRVDTAMWPLKLAWVLLAMTYFSTGITKLLAGGLSWMNGYTLQIYTFGDALASGKPLGVWLAGHHTLCILLAIGTILFETFFFVSILLPRTAPLLFLAGIAFHVALYLTSAQPFFQHITLLSILLVCVEPEWWRAWVNRLEVYLSGWRKLQQVQQPS